MNAQEFKSEFNLAYNNLSSNQAPGLDGYEISVYLTKAQDIVVDSLYAEFEKSESARRKLAKLVVTAKLNSIAISDSNTIFPEYTSTYKPLDDVRYIINEQVKISDTKINQYNKKADICVRGTFLKVQPILHDEINDIIDNPYRFNRRRALRLDTSHNNNGNLENYIEILTKGLKDFIEYYQIRYVKNPEPIIIEELTGTDSINGETAITLGSLPQETHRQIVEIAAKMAYADYKQ